MCEQGMKAAAKKECAPGSRTEKVPPSIEEYRDSICELIGNMKNARSLKRVYELTEYLYIKE